jgi:hypothetical protein
MAMSRKSYPGDIRREQFDSIREMLEGASNKTPPRSHSVRLSAQPLLAGLLMIPQICVVG